MLRPYRLFNEISRRQPRQRVKILNLNQKLSFGLGFGFCQAFGSTLKMGTESSCVPGKILLNSVAAKNSITLHTV